MPSHHPKLPPPPQPTKIFFDPFQSSSTGHQTDKAILAGSTAWRDSRSHKLSHQFRDTSGRGGKRHVSDLVGAGSENFGKDGRKPNGEWEKGASGLREKGWQDIRGLMAGTRKRSSNSLNDGDVKAESERSMKRQKSEVVRGSLKPQVTPDTEDDEADDTIQESAEALTASEHHSDPPEQPPQIFRGLTIYLNGSTAPLVSDHKLKQLFAQHGGNSSLALGRRTVTHVILGEKCGGGLASGKIEKEVKLVRGKGIKFVTVQWVLDSVEKGIRQPEARYAPKHLDGRIGGSGQGSVRDVFTKR